MTDASTEPRPGNAAGDGVGIGWSAAACLWLLLLLVATAGRSFNAGPWRVYAVALAAIIGIGFCAARAAGVLRLSLAHPSQTDRAPSERDAGRAVAMLALGAIAFNVSGIWAAGSPIRLLGWFGLGVGGIAALGLALLPVGSEMRRATRASAIAWWCFVAATACVHSAAISAEPIPPIDVLDHMGRAGDSLLLGANPYSQPVPDFFGGQSPYGFDTPGFPYPPAVLAVAALARSVGLDVRWLLLACVLAAAGVTRAIALRAGWSREVACLLGILFLAVPRQSYFLTSGFSEPVSGLLLMGAIWFWLAGRRHMSLLALGLFLSSKQYLLVAAPLLALACASASELVWLAAGTLVLWLPFAVWDPVALWHAAFGIHLARPPRTDGLTWSAWRMALGGEALASWIPLASGLAAALLAGLPRPATPASLCLGLACALTLTLFLSPQAFGNYYLLTSWALIGAIASLPAGAAGALAEPVGERRAGS